ncbi:hypothetical protein M758_11G019000 [Ceratodon purpureus]|uniref:Secreted protein n=1 Tax=Ceratodon purpureus TaxID=3225 RepID=A0A8T0GDY1_CERPU|nr:hypothetical protein KC19_11G020700 [Ceratodon purpureus]KAG0600255.1 hypothetical protein M758_11G019000 [Ceratodon purpureus]
MTSLAACFASAVAVAMPACLIMPFQGMLNPASVVSSQLLIHHGFAKPYRTSIYSLPRSLAATTGRACKRNPRLELKKESHIRTIAFPKPKTCRCSILVPHGKDQEWDMWTTMSMPHTKHECLATFTE